MLKTKRKNESVRDYIIKYLASRENTFRLKMAGMA